MPSTTSRKRTTSRKPAATLPAYLAHPDARVAKVLVWAYQHLHDPTSYSVPDMVKALWPSAPATDGRDSVKGIGQRVRGVLRSTGDGARDNGHGTYKTKAAVASDQGAPTTVQGLLVAAAQARHARITAAAK